EGNEISVDDLIELKENREQLKSEIDSLKVDLRKSYELLPLLIAQKNFEQVINQLEIEEALSAQKVDHTALLQELNKVSKELTEDLKANNYPVKELIAVESAFKKLIEKRKSKKNTPESSI